MANTDLNALSTYADDADLEVLRKAAEMENRSLSNYLLTSGLTRARQEHGLLPFGRESGTKAKATESK